MASAGLSVANSSLQVSSKGLAEFAGFRSSVSSLPFSRKRNDDPFSVVTYQTYAICRRKYKRGPPVALLKAPINGFGRIGRNFLRCWHGRKDSPLDVVVINDTGGVKPASHLLKYDSTLGIFDADVKPEGDNALSVDGKIIKVVSDRNPVNLPWGELGIDLVIKGTGAFVDRDGAGKHIQAGAKKVLITAPGKVDIPTYAVGVNAEDYNPDEPIISNASCTSNSLAPFVKVLDQEFGKLLVRNFRFSGAKMAALLAVNMSLPNISQTLGRHKITDQPQSSSIALTSFEEALSRRKVVSCLVLSWASRPYPAVAGAGGEEPNAEDGNGEGVFGAMKSIFDPNEKTTSGKVLPKAYLKSAREVVKTLRDSLSKEDPKNIVEFRRNADAAKESIRQYLNNWRGQKTVVNEESYIMLEKAIRSIANFYSRAGPSATLPEEIKTEILSDLSKAEEFL